MNRPTIVRCASCDLDVDARTTEEYILLRSLSNSGRGTLTSPTHVQRLGVYICRECRRLEPLTAPREIPVLLSRITDACRQLLHFLAPHDELPRNLFGEQIGRRVG